MKNLLLTFLFITFLAGCGDSSEDIANQFKSGSCGYNVISDYNSMVFDCREPSTADELTECELKLKNLKAKYPGINCSMDLAYGVDEKQLTVTEAYLDHRTIQVESLIEVVKSLPPACNNNEVSDYNKVVESCEDVSSVSLIETCDSAYSYFRSMYPGIYCVAKHIESGEEYIIETEGF
tara:strand:- start:3816 stop:4352 length:537 start_codon:yes stop_codon:yes gene_type:complete